MALALALAHLGHVDSLKLKWQSNWNYMKTKAIHNYSFFIKIATKKIAECGDYLIILINFWVFQNMLIVDKTTFFFHNIPRK